MRTINFCLQGVVLGSDCKHSGMNKLLMSLALQNMDLLARIRQELVRGGHLYNPRVFIHPSLGTNQLKLRDTVKKMGGETVQVMEVRREKTASPNASLIIEIEGRPLHA